MIACPSRPRSVPISGSLVRVVVYVPVFSTLPVNCKGRYYYKKVGRCTPSLRCTLITVAFSLAVTVAWRRLG